MDKQTQDRSRDSLIHKYQEKAFESLALYNYYGQRYQHIEKQVKDMENQIEVCEGFIRDIEALPDHHTVENRNKVKGLKKDCEDYEKRIKGVGDLAKTFFDKASGYREQGVTILEQIDFLKEFKFKTPEEIDAEKKAEEAKVEPKPVDPAGAVTVAA